jgi:hypothetical protein
MNADALITLRTIVKKEDTLINDLDKSNVEVVVSNYNVEVLSEIRRYKKTITTDDNIPWIGLKLEFGDFDVTLFRKEIVEVGNTTKYIAESDLHVVELFIKKDDDPKEELDAYLAKNLTGWALVVEEPSEPTYVKGVPSAATAPDPDPEP